MNTSKYTLYSDLHSREAPGGGNVSSALCVTNIKPDIVIIDKHSKTVHIYELTCPLTRNIKERHMETSTKYAPFITNMTGYHCTVNCFEVCFTGYISYENKITLTKLHKIMKKYLKKFTFLSNLNSLAGYGSYGQ